eukprot:TRINITY_DN40486_c0_g1_i1.p1 TRINITY_DN40486_c0_g1~~TRINITY_DN40486_c0_g1_i1.p1  ORF type:complete len:619 (-),score=74.62 TRINITY_DN40486_c0_g1_i1:168-2024(-)
MALLQSDDNSGSKRSNALCSLRRALWPLFKDHPIESTILAASVAVSSFASTRIWVEFSKVNGASQTALNKRNVADYWYNRRMMFLVMVKLALASSLEEFCSGRLSLRWRAVVTKYLLERYLPVPRTDNGAHNFPFYRMKLGQGSLQNPDQRIADDVADTVDSSVELVRSLISNVVSFASWSWVLFSISPKAFAGLLLYALLGTLVTVRGFARGLVQTQDRVRSCEAHFRHALVRIDECAESVAFYRAADAEQHRLMAAFGKILQAARSRLWWKLGHGTFQRTYSYVTLILPSMILAPAYFRGEVELGAISQIFSAFNSVKQVLMFVANNFGVVADLQAKLGRLEDLRESIDRASMPLPFPSEPTANAAMNNSGITLDEVDCVGGDPLLHVQGVRLLIQPVSTLETRWLGTISGQKDGSSFEIGPGMSLLLKGASGVGKSTLLRAIAGLWKEGVGRIQRTRHVLFLPQSSYLPTGAEGSTSSLREQLLFPDRRNKSVDQSVPSETELLTILDQVHLGDNSEGVARLDQQADWALRLSGGEKQRLAFARLLVQLSRMSANDGEGCLVLLDEATSACDEELENLLYEALSKRLRKGALVSVGHRLSLARFHTCSLELSLFS